MQYDRKVPQAPPCSAWSRTSLNAKNPVVQAPCSKRIGSPLDRVPLLARPEIKPRGDESCPPHFRVAGSSRRNSVEPACPPRQPDQPSKVLHEFLKRAHVGG